MCAKRQIFFILLVSFLCIALCLLVSGLVIFTMYIKFPFIVYSTVNCNSSTSHICPLSPLIVGLCSDITKIVWLKNHKPNVLLISLKRVSIFCIISKRYINEINTLLNMGWFKMTLSSSFSSKNTLSKDYKLWNWFNAIFLII